MNGVFVSKKWNRLLLAFYLSFIIISHIFVRGHLCASAFVIVSFLVIIFSIKAASFLVTYFSVLSLPERCTLKPSRMANFLFFSVPLLVLILYYIAYYPGAFSPDSFNQYEQALTNQYNDWHPVLHTLLAFKLPLLMSGGWNGSMVLFQVLCFSFSLGYCFHVIFRYAGKWFTVASMVFILTNPLSGNIAMYPWKDVAFSMGALLLMVFSLQIFMTRGKWMSEPMHMAAFISVFVLTTIFRHNAVLFTLPLLFAVLFQIHIKRFF